MIYDTFITSQNKIKQENKIYCININQLYIYF